MQWIQTHTHTHTHTHTQTHTHTHTHTHIYIYIYIYIQGVKNNVYNVSGMIEEVKTNMFFYLTKLWLMHRFSARWSYG